MYLNSPLITPSHIFEDIIIYLTSSLVIVFHKAEFIHFCFLVWRKKPLSFSTYTFLFSEIIHLYFPVFRTLLVNFFPLYFSGFRNLSTYISQFSEFFLLNFPAFRKQLLNFFLSLYFPGFRIQLLKFFFPHIVPHTVENVINSHLYLIP